MARDASLPKFVAKVHGSRGTPHYAILFSTALIVGMAIALPIEEVAAAASVMFLLLFGGVNVALIRLRKLRPDLDRGFKVPFVPFTPLLAIGTMLFIAVFMFVDYPLAWAAAGGWIVLGFVFYYAYSRTREKAFLERVEWMERLERREYGVLVAVASPVSVPDLMEVAIALARSHDGEIVVTSVVEVPEGESLLRGRPRVRELEPVLQLAVEYAQARGVVARSVVKIARRISHGIVQTAREEHCNFIVLGQPAGGSVFEKLVTTIGERVLQQAPCHVAIVYGHIPVGAVREIVVPITQGANSRLAAALSESLGDWFEAPAVLVTAIDRSASETQAREAGEIAEHTATEAGVTSTPELRRYQDVKRGLLGLTRGDRIVLIGAPREGPISPVFGETMPGAIAERGNGPVVVVRNVESSRISRFERVFFRRS
jgi:nucleotide-binding universal stress UspA family protein